MTKEQISNFTYCKSHLECFDGWVGQLPFKSQKYGCGTGSEPITFQLEKIHLEMYNGVLAAIQSAQLKIEKIVEEI